MAAAPSAATCFQVTPAVVEFREVQPGEPQSAQLTIKACCELQNVDSRVRGVRIRSFATSSFLLKGPQGNVRLAPGLTVCCEVLFQGCDGSREYHDRLVIMADDNGRLMVPCRALPPRPQITLNGSLNMGVVLHESLTQRALHLTNEGPQPATFRLETDGSLPVRVSPAEGQLGARGSPDSSLQVKVDFTADNTGPVSGKLSLFQLPSDTPLQILDLTATVVSHTFQLLDSEELVINAVDFGSLYFGDSASRRLTLINHGPRDARFFAACGSPRDFSDAGDSGASADDAVGKFLQVSLLAEVVDPADDALMGSLLQACFGHFLQAARLRGKQLKSTEPKRFELQPLNAVVPAYGRASLTVAFNPGRLERRKGFDAGAKLEDEQVTYSGQLTFDGYPQEIKFPVRGRVLEARVAVSRSQLVFGTLPTHSTADENLVLENLCPQLPARFRIPAHSAYHCQPSEGTIVSGATCAVLVTFCPRALGQHSARLEVQVLAQHSSSVVATTHIDVLGQSDSVGRYAVPVGGVSALPESFAKPRKYVDQDEALEQTLRKIKAYKRPQPWENPEVLHCFERHVSAGSKETFSLEDFKRRAAHNDRYTSFIRQNRTHKGKANEAEDSRDLGLQPYKGLRGPEQSLPRVQHDALWLDKSAAAARPQNCPALPLEVVEDIPLHKDKPTTEEEAGQCTQALSKQDLQRIGVGPRVVDFGRVSASSSNTAYLLVNNPLRSSIHVVLAVGALPELKGSEVLSQVVPGGGQAKFPLVLMVPHVQSFSQKVEYVINGCQFFTFEVRAEVVPVSLEISDDELSFAFGLDNWQPFVEQTLMLSNTQPFPAEFKWQLEGPTAAAFSVSPAEGTIRGSNSLQCTVKWMPGSDATPGEQVTSMGLTLKGGDGTSPHVQLRASLPEGKLSFKEKALELGNIPVGVPQATVAVLRNTGSHDGIFLVLPNDAVRCNPDRGRIQSGGSLDLELTLNFLQPQQVQTRLEVEVRGGKALRLPIHGDAVLPAVDIKEAELAFGDVYTGVTVRRSLTVINTSPVPASVNFDLSLRPEFSLELPKENWSTEVHDECPLLRMGRRGSAGSSRSSRRMKPTEAEELAKSKEGARYQLKMLASETLSLFLNYAARREAQHAFDLAAMLVGYGFSVSGAAIVKRKVTASGVRARITASKTIFDFGKSIVIRANQMKPPYALEVTFTSNEAEPVQWQFGHASTEGQEGCKGVFAAEPKSGSLLKGQSCTVNVLFSPKDGRVYTGKLPLFLDGNLAQPYFTFEVRGEGEWPRLKFDMRECILPPVPVGIRAEAQFFVINDGYDNLELKTRLPADEHHLPLTLAFPEGTLIGIAKERLTVVVACTATRPTSFTANVDFLDDDGKRYSLPVTGTTDASLLSIKPFLDVNAGELLWRTTDASAVLLDESVPYTLPEAGMDSIGATVPPLAVSKFLVAVAAKGPYQSIPSEMVASKGRLMLELVELFSGKAVPNRAGSLAANKKEVAQLLVGQYDALLSFLKSHGALLNAVKPELLLDIEEFRTILAKKDAKVVTEADAEEMEFWYQLEDDYEIISFKAWNAVMSQMLKIFVLARVTPKSFKALPGLEGCQLPPDSTLLGSNVYSTAESVLLAWLTVHLSKVLPMAARRIQNFDADLRSGLALYAVLVSHWPELARLGPKLKTAPADEGHMRDNATIVVKLVETLQLPYSLQVDDILKPNALDMLLFVLYLYQALPQLVPRATVEFMGRLQEKQVKYIEVSNPASKPIAYTARLEGHSDFALEAPTIRIEPKGSTRIAVLCKSSTTNPQTSKLILTSKRDGSALAATMVFALRAEVDARGPLKRFKADAQLYEFKEFEVKLTNPFQVDCEFTIRVVHAAAAELDLARLAGTDRKRTAAQRSKKNQKDLQDSEEKPRCFPNPFGVDKLRIRLKANAEETLRAAFLPFTLESHVCCIVFEDLQCGKFVYEVSGETRPPPVFKEYKFQVAAEGAQVRDIQLPWANGQIEAARRAFLDKHPNNKHKDQSRLAKGDGDGPTAITFAVDKSNTRVETMETMLLYKSITAAPKAIAEPAGEATGGAGISDAARAAESPPPNTLRLVLHPVGAGQYPCRVLLQSARDVRLLEVEFTAVKTGQTVVLEFDSPARERVVQEIPIVNPGAAPLTVTADCRGEAFSGPRTFEVPPGMTLGYPFTFSAPWIGEYAGALEMSFAATGEKNTYALLGKATDPVAEGHIVLDCQARTHQGKRVAVPNVVPKKAAEYRIFSDLDCVGGKDSVTVQPGQTGTYTLHVVAPRPGMIQGSVTFMAESGHYIWYYLTLNVTEAPPIATIDVSAAVRKAVAVQLDISNPLNEPASFSVAYGSNMLVGPRHVALAPLQSMHFELFYAPLLPGDSEAELVFSSIKLGNFSYIIKMHADDAPAEVLPEQSAQLGCTARQTVEIQNPTEDDAVLEVSSSNPHNFIVGSPALMLGPYGVGHLTIDYLPSSLSTVEQGTVTLQSPALGTWEYACSGTGRRPDVMEPTVLTAILGQDGSSFVTWRNPFAEPARVDVSLSNAGDEQAAAAAAALEDRGGAEAASAADEVPANRFDMVMKKTRGISVVPYGLLQIPITFAAVCLEVHHGEVQVTMEAPLDAEALVWRFPLQGMSEAETSHEVYRFTCQARSKLEDHLDLRLEGLGRLSGTEVFSHELLIAPSKQSALGHALQLTLVPGCLKQPGDPLRYQLTFAPQKTVKANVGLVVQKSTGGRWRFELKLEATQPEMDGSIIIEAAPGQAATAPVWLFSPVDWPLPFTCHFTHDSSIQFDMWPTEGLLPTQRAPGMKQPEPPITVKYFAKGYGKSPIGKLVILTEDQQWTYVIKGVQPKYLAPDKAKMASHLDNRLPDEVQNRLDVAAASGKTRNYLVHNATAMRKKL